METVHIVNKEIGETPLECLERTRQNLDISEEIPMTYAGRLDPMAEGLMIILVGEECKNKEKYLGLDKEYEVEILFGIETDSYDVLGLIKKIETKKPDSVDLQKYVGKLKQEYPRYSSKVIALKEVPDEMPTKDVEIYSIEKLGEREVTGGEIVKVVEEKVGKVKGDFRQKETLEKWRNLGEVNGKTSFKIIKIKVSCSSGTYMRSLAHRMGKDAGTGAIAYSIKRTRVGEL